MDKILMMLESPKASTRYDACEELRVAAGIPPEAVLALQRLARDPDASVAEAAGNALRAHAPAPAKDAPLKTEAPFEPKVGSASATKKCPYCAEEIKAEAIVCRFCGRDLGPTQGPPSQTQQAPAAKKGRISPVAIAIIIAIALIICVVVVLSGTGGGGGGWVVIPTSRPSTYSVTYEITGSARGVSITLSNAQGGTEQGDYSVPFRKTYTMSTGAFAYISAQNLGESGTVTCTILLNGSPWRTSTSSGAYMIADCSGLVGSD